MTGVLDISDSSNEVSTRSTIFCSRDAIHQPDLRFHGDRVAAFLNDTRTLAVVLTDDNERTTHHAGRRKIGERIGSHVGSNDRLDVTAPRIG